MINIKVYSKKKNSGGGSNNSTSTASSSASTSSSGTNVTDWFYFDPETQSVVCKYQLMANGDIIAFKNGEQES